MQAQFCCFANASGWGIKELEKLLCSYEEMSLLYLFELRGKEKLALFY